MKLLKSLPLSIILFSLSFAQFFYDVDIETTGPNSKKDKVIDVSVKIVENNQLINFDINSQTWHLETQSKEFLKNDDNLQK